MDLRDRPTATRVLGRRSGGHAHRAVSQCSAHRERCARPSGITARHGHRLGFATVNGTTDRSSAFGSRSWTSTCGLAWYGAGELQRGRRARRSSQRSAGRRRRTSGSRSGPSASCCGDVRPWKTARATAIGRSSCAIVEGTGNARYAAIASRHERKCRVRRGPIATPESDEGPRHRRRRVHLRLPRPGAARRRSRRRRARQLQQVRARREVATTTTRATGSSRATPRTSALLDRARRRCATRSSRPPR